jgi:hypothetical protein
MADGISLAYIERKILPTEDRIPFIPPIPLTKPSTPSSPDAKPSLKSIKKSSFIKD